MVTEQELNSITLYRQYNTLSLRLRHAMEVFRKKTGQRITYKLLAQRTGLSQATIESLATRAEYNPTLATLGKLCEALDCTVGDLLESKPFFNNENKQRTRSGSVKRRAK